MKSGTLRVRILGCGSSGGVPRVGNDWGACNPDDPRNRRMRCSILVSYRSDGAENETSILIDTSPDLRQQLLDASVRYLDAIVMSHHHADQCHGIDDVRPLALRQGGPIDMFMDESTYGILGRRFGYCFQETDGYPAIIRPRPELVSGRATIIGGQGGDVTLLSLDQDHGSCRSLGFRVGDFAYCNDVVLLPDETLEQLMGVKVLVVDALRYRPHPTHANVARALGWIEQLRPEQAYLTNLHVDLDYEELDRQTPGNVRPAFDGLELSAQIGGVDV